MQAPTRTQLFAVVARRRVVVRARLALVELRFAGLGLPILAVFGACSSGAGNRGTEGARSDAEVELARMPELAVERAINRTCPRSGKPIAADSLTLYRGFVVGFCDPRCRDDFDAGDAQSLADAAVFDALIEASETDGAR